MQWNPAKTWVVYASLVEGHFDPTGRRDRELVDAFVESGIPKEQVLFFADQDATAENTLNALTHVGAQAQSQDILIFIYSGHGGLVRDKRGWTNSYTVEGDQQLTSRQVIDTIETSFGGALVIIVADNCFSGASVDNVMEHHGKIPMASLSSTAAFDVSWTGWLLIAQLLWLVRGEPWLDVDGDGDISLDDFFQFVEEEMAVVRGFKPSWCIREDIELTFPCHVKSPQHSRAYQRIYANKAGGHHPARILAVDAKSGLAEVQWLDRYGASTGKVSLNECAPISFAQHNIGASVRVDGDADQANPKGARGVVERVFRGLHLVRFDDCDENDLEALYDWVPYEQLTLRKLPYWGAFTPHRRSLAY